MLNIKSREDMANMLKIDEKALVVGMLCKGNSIRSIERMTGHSQLVPVVFGILPIELFTI